MSGDLAVADNSRPQTKLNICEDMLTAAAYGPRTVKPAWKRFDQEFIRHVEPHLTKYSGLYQKASEAGESHAKFLHEMDFSWSGTPHVPPLSEVLYQYRKTMVTEMANGRALEPVVAVLEKGQIHSRVVPYAQENVNNFEASPEFLQGTDFAEVVADGGSLVDLTMESFNGSSIPIALHDLAHLSAYAEWPELAEIQKTLAERVLNRFPPYHDDENRHHDRIVYFNEWLTLMKGPERSKFLQLLIRYSISPKGTLLVNGMKLHPAHSYRAALAKLPEEQRLAALKELARLAPSWLRHVGGASRDIVTREVMATESTVWGLLLQLKASTTLEDKVSAGSRLMAALDFIGQIKLKTWAEEADLKEIGPEHALHYYARGLGIWSPDSWVYQIH